MAKVDVRIVTSAKDCLDVEVFSGIENYISYNGYPDQRLINSTQAIDENGLIYECSIVDETLSYTASMATFDQMSSIVDRIKEYLKTQGMDEDSVNNYDFNRLIEELVRLRGMTY